MEIRTKLSFSDVFNMNWDLALKDRYVFLKMCGYALFFASVFTYYGSLDDMGNLSSFAIYFVLAYGLLAFLTVGFITFVGLISCIISFFYKSYSEKNILIEGSVITESGDSGVETVIPFEKVQFIMVKSDRIYLGFTMFKCFMLKFDEPSGLAKTLDELNGIHSNKKLKMFG